MEKEQENNVVEQEETSNEEENHETNNQSEDETEETEQGGEQSSARTETPDQQIARLKRQLEREKKKGSKKEETKPKETSDERYDRLELKTEGITSKKEQDVVLEYARFKRIDVGEAVKSSVVKAELAELRKKGNVPPPSGRSSNGQSASIDYYAGQIKKGNMTLTQVESPEMRKQLRKMRIFN